MGSDVGTVGRLVASDTRDPWFESSHPQILVIINLLKDKNKEKVAQIMRHLKGIERALTAEVKIEKTSRSRIGLE